MSPKRGEIWEVDLMEVALAIALIVEYQPNES